MNRTFETLLNTLADLPNEALNQSAERLARAEKQHARPEMTAARSGRVRPRRFRIARTMPTTTRNPTLTAAKQKRGMASLMLIDNAERPDQKREFTRED